MLNSECTVSCLHGYNNVMKDNCCHSLSPGLNRLNQKQNVFLSISLTQESSTFFSPHLSIQQINFYVGTADPFLSANLINF